MKNTDPSKFRHIRGHEVPVPHINSSEAPDNAEMTAQTVDFINASNERRKAQGKPPVNGPFCLMCCGCFHLLRKDGSLAFFNPTRGDDQARVFSTLENLNAIARELGWIATDEGNHRCPACRRSAPPEEGRQGCAIPAEMVIVEVKL